MFLMCLIDFLSNSQDKRAGAPQIIFSCVSYQNIEKEAGAPRRLVLSFLVDFILNHSEKTAGAPQMIFLSDFPLTSYSIGKKGGLGPYGAISY